MQASAGALAVLLLATLLTTAACTRGGSADAELVAIEAAASLFGVLPDGRAVRMFSLINANRIQVRAIEYGAILQSIEVPDRHGELADVALGYDTLEGYLGESPYFGAVVGRYAEP